MAMFMAVDYIVAHVFLSESIANWVFVFGDAIG
jgi:hypothetical protein